MQSPVIPPSPGQAVAQPVQRDPSSYAFVFHGTGASFFAVMLKNMLLTLLTLGIYLPWSKTERRRYLWQNTEFHGHRLRYHGTGRELFVGYVKVVAAYVAFVGVPLVISKVVGATAGTVVQVVLALMLLPLLPFAVWGARRYLLSRTSYRGVHLRLDGDARAYARTFLLGYLLTLVTLGLYGPVWMNKMYRQLTNATALGSKHFEYRGVDGEVFKIAIKGILLSILTLGIYLFWFQAELNRYQMRHTWFDGAHGELTLTGLDLLVLTVIQIAALTLTLGLAFPWVMTYSLRFSMERLRFVGSIDFGRVYQVASEGEAAADGLADALDVGLAI